LEVGENSLKKIKKLLNYNIEGSGYITSCIIIIIVFMFLFFLFQYMRLWVFTTDIQKKISSAVIQVSQDNYQNIFASSREGYTGAYQLESDNWQVKISTGDVFEELETSLGVEKENSRTFVKKSDGILEYKISDLYVEAKCSRFQSAGDPTEKFEATTSFTLTIPLKFFDQEISPLILNLQSKSNYSTKFMTGG